MSEADRLEALEQGEQARRAEMVTEAAQRAGWHDPAIARPRANRHACANVSRWRCSRGSDPGPSLGGSSPNRFAATTPRATHS
jgi:hypothetical protein